MNNKFSFATLKGVDWIDLLLISYCIYIFFPLFQENGGGLDHSWHLALNYAIKEKWQFGNDVIFTFGPLAFLHTRTAYFINKLIFIPFDLLFLFIVVNAFFKVYKTLPFKKIENFMVIFLLGITAGDPSMDIGFPLLFGLIFLLLQHSSIGLVLAALLSAVALFIKLNTGIIFSVLYLLSTIGLLAFKVETSKKILISWATFVAFLVLLLLLLPVDFGSYLKNAGHVISHYQDAMWLNIKEEGNYLYIHLALTFFLLIVLMLVNIWKANKQNFHYYLLTLCALIYLFILFKTSFTRADFGHISQFLKYLPFPFLLYPVFIPNVDKKNIKIFILPMILYGFVDLGLHRFGVVFTKGEKIGAYFLTLAGGDAFIDSQPGFNGAKQNVKFDENLKKLFQNKRVDILPWDISVLFFNNIQYAGRPGLQSYQSYTCLIDSLNASFVAGDKGPDYIIQDYRSIDDRYPFFDDAKLKIEIWKNYQIQNINQYGLLLSKREKPLKLQKIIKGQKTISLNEIVWLNNDSINVFAAMDIHYSTLGKIQRFFFQPAPLYITFILEDSTKFTHRMIIPELHTGVLVSHYINNIGELAAFYTSNAGLNKRVAGIKLFSPNKEGFEEPLKITLYSISPDHALYKEAGIFIDEISSTDSLFSSIKMITGKFYNEITEKGSLLKISSINFYNNMNQPYNANCIYSIILTGKNGNAYKAKTLLSDYNSENFQTGKKIRFLSPRLSALIDKSKLIPDTYDFYILMESPSEVLLFKQPEKIVAR